MNYKVYNYNQRHLQLKELAEILPSVAPVIKLVDYRNALLTPTNHLFVKHHYKPSGLVTKFDDKKLTFSQQFYLYIKSKWLIKSNRLQGKFFLVHDIYSQNYYHWMCEVLPRTFLLHNAYNSGKVLIPQEFENASFIKESLRILKIQPEWLEGNASNLIEHVITTDTNPNTGDIIPDLQRSLVDAVFTATGIRQNSKGGSKIYLSRKKAKARKIVNEERLLPYLKEFGYEIIYAEDISFTGQISMFANCSSLIALHGAGLTNLMFMPPETKILEIKNPDWRSQPLCFFQLANIFDIKWDYLNGEPLEAKLSNHSDLHVNEKDFYNKLIDFDRL